MSDEQINEIGRKLREIDKDLYLSFVRAENKDSWINQNAGKLEEDSWFTDNYKNIDEFTGDRFKAIADLYRDLDGATPTKARINSFTKKHPDISEQEVLDWFKRTNELKLEEVARREDEADKIRRAREVRDWGPFRSAIASDYEKERYINEPWYATIGDEAAGFIGSSIGSKLDLATGVAGAGADFIPGAGSLVGPTLRLGRDVAHVASGSPYQKTKEQILGGAAVDFGTNLTAWKLPNLRKGARMEASGRDPMVQKYLDLGKMRAATEEGIRQYDNMKPFTATEWQKLFDSMPDSPLKTDLMNLQKKGAPVEDKISSVSRHERELNWTTPEAAGHVDFDYAIRQMNTPEVRQILSSVPEPSEYAKKLATAEPLSMRQKIGLFGAKTVDKLNKGYLGQSGTQVVAHILGKRPGGLSEEYQKPNFEQAKKWYKENYKDDWTKLRFKPVEGDDPAMLEAYKEVMAEEEAKREGREAQYKRFKNLGGNI